MLFDPCHKWLSTVRMMCRGGIQQLILKVREYVYFYTISVNTPVAVLIY